MALTPTFLVCSVAKRTAANNFMEAQTKKYAGDDETNTFGDDGIRLSPAGDLPITHYAAYGAFNVTQQNALDNGFSAAGRWIFKDVTAAEIHTILASDQIEVGGLKIYVPPLPF